MKKKQLYTRRSDGRYVKTIVDQRTGKKLYFYANTERELTQKILEYSAEAEHGRTFAKVADEWWGEASERLAPQSVRSYKNALKSALDHFGKSSVKDITPRNVSAYLVRFARDGYSQKTVAKHKLIVNLILEHAVLEGDIPYNPCASVKLPDAKKKERRPAATHTDEKTIQERTDLWLFPLAAIMTGMRKGELLALQWKDIDFDKNLIHVTKSVYHEGDRPYIKAPKTKAGHRTVPLLPKLKAALLPLKSNANDYIFSDDGKKPLTNRRYITLFSAYTKESGVSCTAHQLRHSFATIAFENGVPVKSVQEILGHKQLSTTMDIYTDFRKSALDQAAELLTAAFEDKQ